MVSPKQLHIEIMKKSLEREKYCKKMWEEIKEKRKEIQKYVEKHRKKLRGKIKRSEEGR